MRTASAGAALALAAFPAAAQNVKMEFDGKCVAGC